MDINILYLTTLTAAKHSVYLTLRDLHASHYTFSPA